MDAGLLPIKSPATAKRRLADDLDVGLHAAVVEALYLDALDLCLAASGPTWWVVSDDDAVLGAAAERGLRVVSDAGGGLNPAIESAIAVVTENGADSVIVIPSDVPLARPEDIVDLLDTGATSDVVVVPSGADGGTNGLFMQPATLLKPSFGPLSLQAHLDAAEKAAARCVVLPLPRLALDIDTIDDVRALVRQPVSENAGRTEQLLRDALGT
jgi:2-phospho-L-lactate/phosphoenolpyruvate guanylyltransferase